MSWLIYKYGLTAFITSSISPFLPLKETALVKTIILQVCSRPNMQQHAILPPNNALLSFFFSLFYSEQRKSHFYDRNENKWGQDCCVTIHFFMEWLLCIHQHSWPNTILCAVSPLCHMLITTHLWYVCTDNSQIWYYSLKTLIQCFTLLPSPLISARRAGLGENWNNQLYSLHAR